MKEALGKRLRSLEVASGQSEIVIHFAEDGHDHGAEWRRLMATGRRIRALVFKGLNDEATDAFLAAKPEGALI